MEGGLLASIFSYFSLAERSDGDAKSRKFAGPVVERSAFRFFDPAPMFFEIAHEFIFSAYAFAAPHSIPACRLGRDGRRAANIRLAHLRRWTSQGCHQGI
jgi:hypothetical protein